jgi:hypothetical protein
VGSLWAGRWGLAVGGTSTVAAAIWLLLDMRGRRLPQLEVEGASAPIASDPSAV